MKIQPSAIHLALWVFLGLTLSLISLALTHPVVPVDGAHAVSAVQTATATAVTEARSGSGSTDGIVLMAVIIVLIVILPIIIRNRDWSNGKRIKKGRPFGSKG